MKKILDLFLLTAIITIVSNYLFSAIAVTPSKYHLNTIVCLNQSLGYICTNTSLKIGSIECFPNTDLMNPNMCGKVISSKILPHIHVKFLTSNTENILLNRIWEIGDTVWVKQERFIVMEKH